LRITMSPRHHYTATMPQLPAARIILAILCASYLLSAGLLTWARFAGQVVPAWKIAGWIVTGLLGAILLIWLSPDRPIISFAMLLALGPWMLFALLEDARSRHYVIATVDLAGLFAIGYAIWMIRRI
jgi:hypothetical protein